jgi:hypothetical protein
MLLSEWFEGFPTAEILLTGNKIPSTRNGLELQQKYADRWQVFSGSHFPKLERWKSQVDFCVFTEFYGYPDKEFMSKNADEKTKQSNFGFLSKMAFTKFDQPVDAGNLFIIIVFINYFYMIITVWFHYPAAQLICIEHNFHIYFTEAQVKTFSTVFDF